MYAHVFLYICYFFFYISNFYKLRQQNDMIKRQQIDDVQFFDKIKTPPLLLVISSSSSSSSFSNDYSIKKIKQEVEEKKCIGVLENPLHLLKFQWFNQDGYKQQYQKLYDEKIKQRVKQDNIQYYKDVEKNARLLFFPVDNWCSKNQIYNPEIIKMQLYKTRLNETIESLKMVMNEISLLQPQGLYMDLFTQKFIDMIFNSCKDLIEVNERFINKVDEE